jgi:hypothetical protein
LDTDHFPEIRRLRKSAVPGELKAIPPDAGPDGLAVGVRDSAVASCHGSVGVASGELRNSGCGVLTGSGGFGSYFASGVSKIILLRVMVFAEVQEVGGGVTLFLLRETA